jgi:hypothetical protein
VQACDSSNDSKTYVFVRIGASCPKREMLKKSAFPQLVRIGATIAFEYQLPPEDYHHA